MQTLRRRSHPAAALTRRATRTAVALVLAAIGLAATVAVDGGSRSRAVRAEFMRQQPCPATGQPRGACPGYQVDHRTPLCIGGADRVENLQWLSIEDHKRKTKIDVRLCRASL